MLNVYLLRHGETRYNADGNKYCGKTDIPLTEKGIDQAKNVEQLLKEISFDAVYSSPLERAHNTAKIATGKEVIKDQRLIEADFGAWEGKTKEEFIAENPELWDNWCNDPEHAKAGGNGDTGLDVIERTDDFFKEMLVKHNGRSIVVVAHNGVNRLYLAWKLGMPLKNYRRIVQENSAITQFELDDHGELYLLKLNNR